MTIQGELEVLYEDIRKINNKTYQALRIRGRILQRINTACETLKVNPTSEVARRSLVINLEREKGFLDIIRRGMKNGRIVLKVTLGITKKYLDDSSRDEMLQMLQLLIDTMDYAKTKIKTVEKRIKKGEKLEMNDYSGQHLNEFLETLKEEEAIDKEIALRLRGESNLVATRMERLLRKTGIKFNLNTAVWGTGSGAAIAGLGAIVNAGGEVSTERIIVATIIGIIAVTYTMMKVTSQQIKDEEDGRREGYGGS